MPIRIRNKADDSTIGFISEDELDFLVLQLEEESSTDTDYFIDAQTLEMLEENGGHPELVAMLRSALGAGDGIDIAWDATPA
jgi:hypothetical protein